MKTTLEHIPESKRKELEQVVEIIKTTTHKSIWAEMVILFWSYARWDFVVKDVIAEWNGTRIYESDFDIMVVTKKPTQEKNLKLAMQMNEKIANNPSIGSHFNIIIEDIHHINKMLEESRYFYIDMKSEWICLYDSKKYSLKAPKQLDKRRKTEIQQEDFDIWYWDANSFFKHYNIAFEDQDYRIGAFLLHQATERYITAYLLVKTAYKPKTHDLEVLYAKVCEIEPKFQALFNLSDKHDKHHFELLKKAYVEARYSKVYIITKAELEFLEQRIKSLAVQVESLCKEEIQK